MTTKVKGSVWDTTDNELFISVKDFGAKGDGVTDDSVAINAAIQSMYNTTVPLGSYHNIPTLFFPNGEYYVTQTIDFSRSKGGATFGDEPGRGLRFLCSGYGAVIISDQPILILDLIGVRQATFEGLEIRSDTPLTGPIMGVLHARQSVTEAGQRAVASKVVYRDFWVRGHFSLRAMEMISTEQVSFYNTTIVNSAEQRECMLFANKDEEGLQSILNTRLLPSEINESFNTVNFSSCEFVNSQSLPSDTVPVMTVSQCQGLHFTNCYWKGEGPAGILVKGDVGGSNGLWVTEGLMEVTGNTEESPGNLKYPDHFVLIQSASKTNSYLGWFLDFRVHNQRLGVSFLGIDTNSASANMEGIEIYASPAVKGTLPGDPLDLIKTVSGTLAMSGHNTLWTQSLLDMSQMSTFTGEVYCELLANLTGNTTNGNTSGTFSTFEGYSGKIQFWKNHTIATGVLTLTQGTGITVLGESGADDLDTITIVGVRDGQRLSLMGTGNIITVKHNTGNILLKSGTDTTINANSRMELSYRVSINKWMEM